MALRDMGDSDWLSEKVENQARSLRNEIRILDFKELGG